MIKKCNFKNPEAEYFYAHAPYAKFDVKYILTEEGNLRNEYNEALGDHDYISLISREKYTAGTEITAKFRFTGVGAPCLVFTDDVEEGEDFPVYGLHFEVCVWKNGVNVWHIIPCPERIERPIKPTRIYFEEYSIPEEEIECVVKFGKKSITVIMRGREFTVEHEDFPEHFRLGFTACEGFCEFTEFSVKTGE